MGLLTDSAKTALQNRSATLAYLLELEFAPATERYWTGVFTLSYDSQSWEPTGGMGAVGELESSPDFRANSLTVAAHGLPVKSMREGNLRPDDYKGRGARFIFAMVRQATVIYAKPKYFFIDQLTYAIVGGEGAVQVALEHETVHAARQSVRRYSDADQQQEYPGDLAFEHLAYLSSGVEIKWGANGSIFRE